MEYIYFIQARGNEVKIGRTKNEPTIRMKALQTGSPVVFNLYGYILVPMWLKTEKIAHDMCKERHIRGEWYRLTEKEIDSLICELKWDPMEIEKYPLPNIGFVR